MCVGRKDQQVRLRGFRIELGEVESIACGVDGVDLATAVVQSIDDAQQLVLFLAPQLVDVAAVREQIYKQFPAFMWPHSMVPLQTFPRTTSDKIDR